jgi:hypothetical protein
MAKGLAARFPGRKIAICLEQSKGSLIYALLKYDCLVVAARKQRPPDLQTRSILGSHSVPTSRGSGSQSPPMNPHCTPTACKQLAEPTVPANLRCLFLEGREPHLQVIPRSQRPPVSGENGPFARSSMSGKPHIKRIISVRING